ncbi:MAG: hypothetical protein ACHBN1_09625 [Heteroscytonema crispum UTEX LB 1556]
MARNNKQVLPDARCPIPDDASRLLSRSREGRWRNNAQGTPDAWVGKPDRSTGATMPITQV